MNKYEIILNVCETHSISKTAAKLNYTQSAISQAIKSYEKELGFPIFKRSKHGNGTVVRHRGRFCFLAYHLPRRKNSTDRLSRTNLDSGFIRIGTIQSISTTGSPIFLKQF